MYIIKNLHCHFEQDHFDHGCIGDCGFKIVDVSFEDSSLIGLIKSVSDFIGSDYYEIDPCGDNENSRIDWQVLETAEGHSPSDYELEQWEQGNIDLYLCNYTAQVFKLEAVNIESELNK
jgi:hypothetical protein